MSSDLEWMMWQIDATQAEDPLALNLIRAIQYYTEKYGSVPNRCEVHPEVAAGLNPPAGMQLTQSKSVKQNCLMLARDAGIDPRIPGRG